MNDTTDSTERTRAAMIEEALALLHLIDSERDNEDINESPQTRGARLLLQAKARQLVATMIAELQAPTGEQPPAACFAAAA
ncbi:hypothetical protein [uncultured Lamprocystis sp.]|jgi:hypothetical protein|uniref:hypothetical protein n=1 Tax=uncultured Lamprocystis sp. TaxID=543132 RepID=UPI0025E0CEA7|nr:hypothetical protein [uncultured Lamprocystis sp.]